MSRSAHTAIVFFAMKNANCNAMPKTSIIIDNHQLSSIIINHRQLLIVINPH